VPFSGFAITVLLAYLLGSIPSGFLLAKARGIDIRQVGSGNIGATNVFRFLGTPAGIAVLLTDAAKGWLAVYFLPRLVPGLVHWSPTAMQLEWLRIVAGLGAVLGHNYTCWLHFKGGKGIATSAGVLIALVPKALLIILIVWLIVFLVSRFVSLASICAAAALPIASWATGESLLLILVTTAMGGLAIYKHKANISRLTKGTESRIKFKSRVRTEQAG
jgi:glycerol-3-phosphate acyltransferase PlsY